MVVRVNTLKKSGEHAGNSATKGVDREGQGSEAGRGDEAAGEGGGTITTACGIYERLPPDEEEANDNAKDPPGGPVTESLNARWTFYYIYKDTSGQKKKGGYFAGLKRIFTIDCIEDFWK